MDRNLALIYLHLAVLLFGLSGLFGKWLSIDAAAIVFGRTLVAAIAVYCVLQFRGAARAPVPQGSMGLTLLSGAVLALHWGTFFYAIQISTVAIGLVGFSAFPVFVTFVEPLLSKQTLRPVDGLSAAMVTLGLVLVAPSFDWQDAGTQGLLWAVLSGALFAMLTLMNRHLISRQPVMPLALVQHAAACALALPFVWMAGAFPSLSDWGVLVALGVFCTALPHVLFVQSLSAIKAQLASVVAGLEPVYGVIFAALLLGEIPALSTLVGGVVVLAAVLLAVRAHASESH